MKKQVDVWECAEEAINLAAAFLIGFISGIMLHLAWAVGEALSSGVPL